MTWAHWHKVSEDLASQASVDLREGRPQRAAELYVEAAEAEEKAIAELDPTKTRTLAITAVSAASLWFKAREYKRAEQAAFKFLQNYDLPRFAVDELRLVLQSVWVDTAMDSSGASFLPGKILVSVKGGEIVPGAAPLGVIVEKIQTIQAMFYRTVELNRGLPHRSRGSASKEVQEAFTPWLLQAAPGSYQFAVAIREPSQMSLLDMDDVDTARIANQFFEIVQASVSQDLESIETLVPDKSYASTFLKLTRNLAPTGKTFDSIEIRSVGDQRTVSLGTDTRKAISTNLRAMMPLSPEVRESEEVEVKGVLRAVHLERDWIEILVEPGKTVHLQDVKDPVDDVIGPMVNKRVIARGRQIGDQVRFIDIELDE